MIQAATNDEILSALKGVIDPELGISVVDLGLVYRVAWSRDGIDVALTMTTPACPLGEMLVEEAELALKRRFPETQSRVVLVWDPPWSPARINEEGRRQLGWPAAADAAASDPNTKTK